jgi:uncharacterized LabA/DUF88 family protein
MINKSNNFAFLDSQNLNLGIKQQGWILDFKRFRVYLQEKYGISKAFLFIGYIPTNQSLYTALQSFGYILVFKPTLQGAKGKIKGNVDAELVLHAMKELPHYDKALIVSGDGDFACLIEYLNKMKKLLNLMIPDQGQYSSLLRKFNAEIIFMNNLRAKLEYHQP